MIINLLACLLCSQTDSNVYTQFVKTLRSASTVTGRVAVIRTTPHQTISYTQVFQFQLPNLSRIETWYGKRLAELEVEDGKSYWDYTASPKHLVEQPIFPWFMQMNGYMIEPFLNIAHKEKAPEYIAVSSEPTPTTFHGHPALRVEIRSERKPKEPHKDPDEVYMDPKTGLPIGAIVHASRVNYTTEYIFENLKIGKPIDRAVFEYKPQIAANADQMDDLLPVGMKAPLFKGTALGERPFNLATTMKGAKAVILNFWGLGCAGCRSELPKLQDLQNRFAAKGLRVVTFQPLDDNKILTSFMKKAHLSLTTVFEGTCKPLAVDAAYRGAMAEPVTYLIDGKGMIVLRFFGDDVTQLTKDLASLGLKD